MRARWELGHDLFWNFRRWTRYSVLLLAALLLTSCVRAQPALTASSDTEIIEVYYMAPEDREDMVRPVSLQAPSGEVLQAALRALLTPPEELPRVFPEGVTLRSVNLENQLLTVDLSEPYGELRGMSLTVADACLALTMCRFRGISRVRITVEGMPHPGREDRTLTASDIVLTLRS